MKYNKDIPYELFLPAAGGNISYKGKPDIKGVLNVYKNYENYNKDLLPLLEKIKDLKDLNIEPKQDYTPDKMKKNGDKLWFHQNKNVELLLFKKTHLLEDEMRTGKTLSVISAIYWDKKFKHNWKKILITPGSKTLMYKWRDDILQNTDLEVVLLEGKKVEKYQDFLTTNRDLILIASKDTIKSFYRARNKSEEEIYKVALAFKTLKEVDIDLWVIDESHFLANRNSQQTKIFLKIRNYVDNVILMTGTPVNESMTNYFAAINFLYPNVSYWTLLGMFFYFIKKRIGYNKYITVYELNDLQKEEFETLRELVASKIELREINSNVVDYKEYTKKVWLTPTQLEYQKSLLEFFEIKQKDLDPWKKFQLVRHQGKYDLIVKTPIEAITRLEQLTLDPRLFEEKFAFWNLNPGAKTIQTLRIIFKNRGKKILIFCRLKSYLDLLYKDIKYLNKKEKIPVKTEFLVGNMTNTKKNNTIKAFQDGEVDVLLIQNRVGSTGLTLSNADITIIPSLSWNYNEKDQIKERMRSIKEKRRQHYIYLTSDGIYDRLVEEKIVDKRENGVPVASFEQLKELDKAYAATYGETSDKIQELINKRKGF